MRSALRPETSSGRSAGKESPSERRERRADLHLAAAGGVAAAIVGFGGMAIVGTATAVEARRLLDASLLTVRFAASAYVAGGVTVLALMLTLITFSMSHELEFRETYFRRIREISAITTMVIVGSVLLLMFLSFPLDEADVEAGHYVWVYYAVLLGAAISGGLFISVVLMLMYAVRGLIGVAEDADGSDLVVTGNEDTDGSDLVVTGNADADSASGDGREPARAQRGSSVGS